jgi:DNA helicase-2/ATP-dependent DNA helicase PcrA
VVAENQAKKALGYQLDQEDRKDIDGFEKGQGSLLVLTRHNPTSRALRSFFNRRIPLWEGHTRPGLEGLVHSIGTAANDALALAKAVVRFMGEVGKGFTPSAFGDAFEREVASNCAKRRTGKAATIQGLAKCLLDEPSHRGVAAVLNRVTELKASDPAFGEIEFDCRREFWEATRLGEFESADIGLAEITHRRTYSRPKPPARAISNIHKAKGLECESVIIMPCDSHTFPDTDEARCLLYVALSRAKSRLMVVVSRKNPSPLLAF